MLFLLLLYLLAHPQESVAQLINSSIQGSVLSEQGAVLAGASVSIQNSDIGLVRRIKTDVGGRYRASLLPPGSYHIAAQHLGSGATQRDLILGIAETRSVNLVLGSGLAPPLE